MRGISDRNVVFHGPLALQPKYLKKETKLLFKIVTFWYLSSKVVSSLVRSWTPTMISAVIITIIINVNKKRPFCRLYPFFKF